MPTEHLKPVEKYFIAPLVREETGTSHHQLHNTQINSIKQVRVPIKRRKHTDSISESLLIKEKLPSSSLSTVGKNNNILIPRNNHNILNSIDLKGTDGAALKKLMNNNNGDLINGDGFNDDDDEEMDDNSDSETVTGDESLFEPEDEDTESDEYIDEEEIDHKVYNNKKKNSIVTILN